MTKQIKHGDLIKLAAWKIETAKVCTLVGFYSAPQYSSGVDVVAAVAQSRSRGNPEVFATFAGHVIAADPGIYKRDVARNAAAIVVEDGETVEVDGKSYTVKVARGNHDYPRNSDPISFVPVDALLPANEFTPAAPLLVMAQPTAADLELCAVIASKLPSKRKPAKRSKR
jgi:hypothetical protein